MLGERVGDAARGVGQLARLGAVVAALDHPDAALDLADVVEVAVQAPAVDGAELLADLRHVAQDPVEDAAPGRPPLGPLLRRAAGPEQHLERHPRVADHRQRLARRRPADRVGVGARVVVGAAARLVQVLDAELERRHRRRLAEAPRVELVERRPDEQVGALRLLRVGLGEEDGRRPEVVAADLRRAERLGHAHVGVADDAQVVAEGLERLQRALVRQLEVGADRGRREQVAARPPLVAAGQPVDLLDADQARHVRRGRRDGAPEAARRDHRVEQRQRHGSAHAAQERAARQVCSGDERHGLSSPGNRCPRGSDSRPASLRKSAPFQGADSLPGSLAQSPRLRWNASLLTTPMMNDAIR